VASNSTTPPCRNVCPIIAPGWHGGRDLGIVSHANRAIDAYVRAALAADPVRADWRHDTEWNVLAPEAVHVPVLLFQAELDPNARTDEYARVFTRLGTADRQWVMIPRGDHAALLEDTAPHDRGRPCLHRPAVRRPTGPIHVVAPDAITHNDDGSIVLRSGSSRRGSRARSAARAGRAPAHRLEHAADRALGDRV
jgi:hypothetical protein